MQKICQNCGYVTEKKDSKCPVCGGPLGARYETDLSACDPREEAEWNGGYHNDFEEGRKTGEYCDPKFEKYANGGEHYHGTEKETYNEEKTYNKKVTYSQKTIPDTIPRDISELPPAIQVIVSLFIGLSFPVVGPILLMIFTKKAENENGAKRIKKTAVICLIISFIWLFIRFCFNFLLKI